MSISDGGQVIGLCTFGWSNPVDKLDWLERYQRRVLLPEQELMIAVLEDAISCYLNGVKLTSGYRKAETQARLMRETEDWMFQGDPDYTFSFENCCEAALLNPAVVRKALAEKKAA